MAQPNEHRHAVSRYKSLQQNTDSFMYSRPHTHFFSFTSWGWTLVRILWRIRTLQDHSDRQWCFRRTLLLLSSNICLLPYRQFSYEQGERFSRAGMSGSFLSSPGRVSGTQSCLFGYCLLNGGRNKWINSREPRSGRLNKFCFAFSGSLSWWMESKGPTCLFYSLKTGSVLNGF